MTRPWRIPAPLAAETVPHPHSSRAERFPGGGRPGGQEGRSLPGPGVRRHRQHSPAQAPRTLDLRRAPVEPFGQGLRPRPHGLPPAHAGKGVTPLEVTADHVKLYKRTLLEAGRTSATVARRLSVIHGASGHRRQGTGALGDGPGHRCGQGPRRAEELHTVLDPAAGHFDVGGDSDRHLAGDALPWP